MKAKTSQTSYDPLRSGYRGGNSKGDPVPPKGGSGAVRKNDRPTDSERKEKGK